MNKLKILAIEDEVKIANLTKKVLEKENYHVDLAHNGKDGLKMALENGYDLILLDVMIPEINGIDVCKILRNKQNQTPIIMLTARDTIEDRLSAMDAGANDYISKPFAFDDLIMRIKALFGSSINSEEEHLAEINKRVMDNVPVSIITIDKEGNVTSANKYYKNLTKKEDFTKTNVLSGEFFIREKLVADYRKLLTDGTPVKKDRCYEKNTEGKRKYLKILAVPLFDKNGLIDGAVSMAQDNTESVLFKRKLQKLNESLEKKIAGRTVQLDNANKELAKMLKWKSMFMADISHEMRTSLAIIQGNAELVSRGLVEGNEKDEAHEQVFGEIKRMSTMLSDLTLISSEEASMHKLNYEKIDVNQFIATLCKSLSVMAHEKKVEMIHENSDSDLEIVADPKQLEKMLMNLLKNAIKYNKKNGKVWVWSQEKENEIVFNVKDSGIGIALENIPHIFERFYRVDKARTRDDGSSGLGLAICKWVARTHGGKIDVSSQLGEGSLFTVSLPKKQKTKKQKMLDI